MPTSLDWRARSGRFRVDVAKKLLKIGELAGRTGRSVRALRLYEERGLLSPAERTDSGYRMYEEGQTERIEYIDRLQKAGLSLSEIGELVDEWKEHERPPEAMEQLRRQDPSHKYQHLCLKGAPPAGRNLP